MRTAVFIGVPTYLSFTESQLVLVAPCKRFSTAVTGKRLLYATYVGEEVQIYQCLGN
jgi:hypothetical protein